MRLLSIAAVLCIYSSSFATISFSSNTLTYSSTSDLSTTIDPSGQKDVTNSYGVSKSSFQALNPQIVGFDSAPAASQTLRTLVANYDATNTVTFTFPSAMYNYGSVTTVGRGAFSGTNARHAISTVPVQNGSLYDWFDATIATTGGRGVQSLGFCAGFRNDQSVAAGQVLYTLSDATTDTVTLPTLGGSGNPEYVFIGYTAPTGKTITRVQAARTSAAGGGYVSIDDLSWVMSPLPQVTLSRNNASIAEAGGVCTLTATLDRTSTQTVTVNLGYTGTATQGTDYTAANSITISPGNLTGTTNITATQDTIYEGNETVIVDITSVTNGQESGTQQVSTTITDDDSQPTVTLSRNNASIAEAAGVSTLTATLSNASTQNVTVNLGYTGTATQGTDYTAANSITVNAGQLTGTTNITATQDTIYEGNETVIVDITSVTNGTESGTQQVTVTITDDDSQPTVTLSRNNATIAEAAGVSTLTATLSNASTQNVTVNLGYTGTATQGTDYTAANSITVNAGQLTGTTNITATQDTVYEGNETVIVDITSVTNGTESGTQQVTVTITDDDSQPTVTLSRNNATIAEAAGVSTLTATLSNASTQNVTVNLGYTGTATQGTDYTAANSIVVTAGQLTGTTDITATQDSLVEGNETIIVDITGVTNGTENGTQQVTVTITDDDTGGGSTIVALKRDAGLTAGGATDARFNGATVRTVTVADAALNGPSDWLWYNYGAVNAAGLNNLYKFDLSSIPTGSTVNLAQLRLYHTGGNGGLGNGDVSRITTHNWIEGTQTGGYPGAAGGVSSAHPIGYNTGSYQNASGGGTAPLQSWGTTNDQFFSLTGDATSPIAPFSAPSGTGYHVYDVTSHVQAWVNGTYPNYGWANASGYWDFHTSEAGTALEPVLFVDYSGGLPTVTLSRNNATIAEAAGVSTLTATLSATSAQTVTVNLGYTGTATQGTDYTAANSITINAGQLTGTTNITATQDTLYEGNETIIVDITSVTNGTESGTQQVTVTITEDDSQPSVTLSRNNATIAEAAGVSTLTATLSNASTQNVTVNLGYTGTATQGTDYSAANSITVTAGQLTGTTDITAIQDSLVEGNETIIVDITSVTNGTESGTQQVTVTITDDDGGPTIVALKRDAGLTAGGATDARFNGATVRTVTVSDAGLANAGDGRYYNYGTAATSGPNTLYKFNLSSIPAGSTINLAQLRLYHTGGNGALGNGDVSRITTHDWTEGTVNGTFPGAAGGVSNAHPIGYNTGPDQNASGGGTAPLQSWGTTNDQFFSLTGDATSPITPFSAPSGTGYHVYDVTSHVQAWVSGTNPNYGWALYNGYFDFQCSEAGTAYEPVLFVDYTGGGGGDTTAPAAVSNLAAGTPTSSSLTVSWTAPGDDGSTGTAASYDIRYSTSTINEGNWASATQVTGEPAPAVAGTNQNMVVSGLSASTTYYFAIKTSDEVPNTSAISNCPSGTTSSGSDTTAPAAVANLAAGTPTSGSLTLTWTAPGDDGSTGTATTYDIRYRTGGVVNDSNWASATQVSGEPAPQVAGTGQSMIVTGLSASTTYYFAIKTADEVPNWSAISNSPSGTTSAPGSSTIAALKRHAGLLAGGAIDSRFNGATVRTVTVADTALSPFGFGRWYNNGASVAPGSTMLYKFDVSSIPSNSTVNLAQLRVYHTGGNGANGNGDVARILTHNWTEGTADGTYPGAAGGASLAHPIGYNTDHDQNASGGTTPPLMSWGPNSDSFFNFAEDIGDIGLTVSPSDAPTGTGYHVIPVTVHVQQWVNGTCPNYGFAQLCGNFDFHCSEAGTDQEPVLFVDYTPGGGSDAVAPAAVANLATGSPTATTITLSWTAPGDDGNTGTATSYDIRYRIGAAIDSSAWLYATKVTGEPVPAVAGTNQNMTITGLTPGVTYYFAIKTTDDAYLTSTLSNSPWGTTTAETDTTAPAAVANLATSNPSLGTVTLTWTAPGDDGNTGTATYYDIRYRTGGAVNDSNWASATQVVGEPAPVLAGISQNMTVSGLSPGTTYYFAIKTTDNMANTSAISNSPSATTLSGTSKTLLTPKDFKYLGYYVLQRGGPLGDVYAALGLTHRYVGGQLRFLTMSLLSGYQLIEVAKPANFGDTVTTTTNLWPDIMQGTQSLPVGFVRLGLWYDSAQSRLWSTSAPDYPDNSDAQHGPAIVIRTLNSDGTVSNVGGPWSLQGIDNRRLYGGAQPLPSWFQTTYGTAPYAVGWGGYSSVLGSGPRGAPSLGPTFYAIPDPTGYAVYPTDIPNTAFKSLMDHGSATLSGDWYASGWPTSLDRGVRNSDVINQLDAGGWTSPSPDGLGRWTWDTNLSTGCWIETAAKQGFITVPWLLSGRAWYESSAWHYERLTSEIQVFDPHMLGQAAQGTRAAWNTYPTYRRSVTDESVTPGLGAPVAATYDSTTQTLYVLSTGGGMDARILVYEVGNANAPVSDVALTEISTIGPVTGTRANTETKDGVYESIQESLMGGTSQLDHKWIFNVTGGSSVTFNVKAYHNSNSDGDDFVFAYSTDGTTWTNMVTVTKTADDGNFQTYTMPGGTSGTVYVRVQDADRTAGHNNLDTIYIDKLYFLSNP